MDRYKLFLEDNSYQNFKICNVQNQELVTAQELDILAHKLFHEDEFSVSVAPPPPPTSGEQTKSVVITDVHSAVRHHNYISGILVLDNAKTYGRHNKSKMYYKCIPDSRFLPVFLVPYAAKLGFSKRITNLYITFKFARWEAGQKHPMGTISNVIGPVDDLSAFYEYQLYCKSLNASLQNFKRETSQRLKAKSEDEFIAQILETYPKIVDKTQREASHVFTIDSAGCSDYDDALQIESVDGEQTKWKLCIYIANVSVWMDILNLWGAFSNRISTIYLPDRKRPMLPAALSECLCSLVAGATRIAFTCELTVVDGKIETISYYNSAVKVAKNYAYEERALLANPAYRQILAVTRALAGTQPFLPAIKNSYDVVTYLMILMNYESSKQFIGFGNGVFRTAFLKKDLDIPDTVSDNVKNFITIWNSQSGEYVLAHTAQRHGHELLNLKSYCHITSPIRRLVDLLNMIVLQENLNLLDFAQEPTPESAASSVSVSKAMRFVDNWLSRLDYINQCMKSIKRVQTECELLTLFHEKSRARDDLSGAGLRYEGVVFNKTQRDDGLYTYHVYLPELKMLTKMRMKDDLSNYYSTPMNLYYFKDENTLKQKIKLEVAAGGI